MQLKNLVYLVTCLSFSLICGAAIYEHTVLWPPAFSRLPASLTVFQGEYKLNNGTFWMTIHPVTLTLLIIVTVLSWRTERKRYVLVPMITYIVVLVATFAYFVPELLGIIGTKWSDTYDETLTARGSRWVNLSIIRMIVLFGAALVLYTGLTKSNTASKRTTA